VPTSSENALALDVSARRRSRREGRRNGVLQK